jgi:predicted acyltransferase
VKGARITSVDALRGFDMFWIVGAGSIVQAVKQLHENDLTRSLATQLTHVPWEGFHFYDLIFPMFLFIVGVSMVFSLDRAKAQHGRLGMLRRVLWRCVLLFALGVLYYGGLSRPWPEVQLLGVLQRIALCYLGAALIYCWVPNAPGLVASAVGLLVLYWALLTFVPFPDLRLERNVVDALSAQVGSAAPADIAAAVPARVSGVYEEGRNLTNYLDFRFLPGKKAQGYYINEGLLSTLPAIALPLFGALAGLLLKRPDLPPRRKVVWLLAGGAVGVGLGLLWSLQFPLIKRIWTSSFILLTAGLSAWLLAVFYYAIDVCGRSTWCRPFIWIGCNSILIYLAVRLVNFRELASRLTGGDVKRALDTYVAQGFGGFVIELTGLTLAILLVRFLYQRNIFLRV